MDDTYIVDTIRDLYDSYRGSGKQPEEFAVEFYNTVGDILEVKFPTKIDPRQIGLFKEDG
jgi:hypothetical protein